MPGKAGSEITRPRCARCSDRFRFFIRFAGHVFGSAQGDLKNTTPPHPGPPRRGGNCSGLGHRHRCHMPKTLIVRQARAAPTRLWPLKFRCEQPKKGGGKRIKKRNLSEPQASLFRFPLSPSLLRVPPQGAANRGRLFCLLFWRSKKVSGPPGPVPASLHGVTTELHHRRENNQSNADENENPNGSNRYRCSLKIAADDMSTSPTANGMVDE